MNILKYLILLFLFGQLFNLMAQPSKTWVHYRRGKQFLFDSSYGKAMNEFLPVMNDSLKKRKIIPNSYYYYAYCAYKNNELKNANFALHHLIEDYPEWSNMNMAYYLKGVIQLKTGLYQQGIQIFKKCKKNKFSSEISDAKNHFLRNAPIDTLQNLKKQYPDEELFKQIIEAKSKINDFNVAVLFPFGKKFSRKRDEFYNLYASLEEGIKKLKNDKIRINLYPYNTGLDTTSIINLFKNKDFSNIDLIIGPFFKEQFKIAAKYCKHRSINIINPFRRDSSLINNNKYAYLLNPSYKTQGIKTAKFCYNKFEGKKSAVIFLNNTKDSLIANAYKRKYEQLGGKVILFNSFDRKSSSEIYDSLKTIKLDSLSHIYAFGNEQSLATNLFSYVENELIEGTIKYGEQEEEKKKEKERKRKEKNKKEEKDSVTVGDIPIIAGSHWLSFTAISYNQFNLHNTHFVIPDYIKKNNDEAEEFSRIFQKRINLPPDDDSYLVYDMIYFFGHVMHKYSNFFYKNLKGLPKTDGLFLPGYDYRNGNDNQFVPIVKLKKNRLKVVNNFKGKGWQKLKDKKSK